MENHDIYTDEALDIIKKFLQLTAKDYIQPALRFSRLSSERQSWETAREFILGEIAIPWGDYLTLAFEDMCSILELDPQWFHAKIDQERISRTEQFLTRRRKKKKDLMSIVCFTHCCSQKIIADLRPKLKKIGISPIVSPAGPVEFYTDISTKKLSNLETEEEEEILLKREAIRRQIDRHTLLLSRADIMLVVWTTGVDEYQVLMDVVTAYRNYLPVYIIAMEDGPAIDLEILSCARTVTAGKDAADKMLSIIRDFVGSGRAHIARSVKPKMADLLVER